MLVTLPFAPAGGGAGLRWAALLVLPAAALLHPGIARAGCSTAGCACSGREPLEQWTSLRGTAVATAWALVAWVLAGLQIWLLAVPLGAPATWRTFALTTGGYALAWAIGLVVVVAPAGAGAREVALAAVLSTGARPRRRRRRRAALAGALHGRRPRARRASASRRGAAEARGVTPRSAPERPVDG